MTDIMIVNEEEFAKKIADRALDEILYNGRTIREWVEIITADNNKLAIETLEKARDDMQEYMYTLQSKSITLGAIHCAQVVEKYIKELKGENNG